MIKCICKLFCLQKETEKKILMFVFNLKWNQAKKIKQNWRSYLMQWPCQISHRINYICFTRVLQMLTTIK